MVQLTSQTMIQGMEQEVFLLLSISTMLAEISISQKMTRPPWVLVLIFQQMVLLLLMMMWTSQYGALGTLGLMNMKHRLVVFRYMRCTILLIIVTKR